MTKKIKKKRLNKKRTLVFILLIYIIACAIYYLINQPIKHIEIIGNEHVTDAEILRISKLKDYPSILKYSSRKIKKSIKTNKLINNVTVKKTLGLKVIIKIEENKMLFYNKSIDKIVLSNGNIIKKDNNDVYGIPILINEVKSDILSKFINNFSKLNDNIIYEISTIEYYPAYSDDGTIINEDRFKIIMNDGNTIIANIKSISVINKYNDIYASLNDKKGVINLDSNKLSNLVFIPYEEENTNENVEDVENSEVIEDQ